MRSRIARGFVAAALILLPIATGAHISIASGPAFASTSQEIAFGIGHGCTGSDAYSVRVEIPSGVTAVRPMTSDFGQATVEEDSAGVVTAVTWQKADANVLDSDSNDYELILRIKAPDQPFTTPYFPTHQTCKGPDGGTSTTDWVGTNGEAVDGGPEPAPALTILPARKPDWSEYKVPRALSDPAPLFGDALTVWRGNAAYSANLHTAEQIKATSSVTALTSLDANDEVWVKYGCVAREAAARWGRLRVSCCCRRGSSRKAPESKAASQGRPPLSRRRAAHDPLRFGPTRHAS